VVFEDTAALLGLLAAFLGVLLGHLLKNPSFAGGASVMIGVILAAVAVLLTLDVHFRPGLSAVDVESGVDRLEQAVREHYPQVTRIFIEAEAFAENRQTGESTANG
jgi:hypothetical protein